MKEIELTPKAEEELEVTWDYGFRLPGILQADEYTGGKARMAPTLAQTLSSGCNFHHNKAYYDHHRCENTHRCCRFTQKI